MASSGGAAADGAGRGAGRPGRGLQARAAAGAPAAGADDPPLPRCAGLRARGPQEREGDGRTPEGAYAIDARNPQSAFHLSLRVSYPDAADKARAAAAGVPPGGDIFIHGLPNGRASSSCAIRAATGPSAVSR
jgi:hypothetical protein